MAEKILTIFADSNTLYPRCVSVGTRGSFGGVKLRFELSDEWDGMTTKVVFHPKRGKPIEVPYLGGEIDVPPEVMKYEGESQYVLSGIRMNGDDIAEKKISLAGSVIVEFTLDDRGCNSVSATPDAYNMLLLQAQGYMEGILRDAKESGEFDGEDGARGEKGDKGDKGDKGERGEKGEKGDPGEKGEKGEKGADGTIVFEELTPEQIEMLRGEKGEKGDKGDSGPQGERGEQGIQGEKGEKGDTGSQGIRGEKGEKGEKGDVGEPFVYSDFTPAQLETLKGEKGEKGDKGDTGSQGEKGEKGEKGDTGETGKGLDIKGTYDTLSALQSVVKSPEQGDMYNVGTASPYTIYMYDAKLGWVSQGRLQGAPGAVFTPAVSSSGVLSWTNNGGLANPQSVNIKGDKGDTGDKGDKGDTGATGAAGADGKSAVIKSVTATVGTGTGTPSVTATLGGTSLERTIALAFDGLKGAKGDKGDTGAQGEKGADGAQGETGPAGANGTSVTVLSVSESSVDGGSNVVTFSDGKKMTVKNGKKGSDGEKGEKGDPGEKGADGSAGANGVSATHSWNGTTLTITSASGTSSANLKGEKGEKGEKGDDGPPGSAGHTPVKGTDYFTDADKSEIAGMVIDLLPEWKGGEY